MEKSCEKCYWTDSAFKDSYCNKCKEFSKFEAFCPNCNEDIAEYEFEGKLYCADCMMQKLGIEKREVTTYEYYVNGDLVGNCDDYLDCEVIAIAHSKAKRVTF